ncbi:phage portal protein [Sphingomonas sp. SFZ2018-12]|uniref:phage portal protein n=1 Tax=Sphingomonas sp. SFZ2018-12 TaxID=2683197 RepID=UPI001F0E8F0D|nr:phage portal protein [Sphingomonas sp. SFZ2018-12]MCH4893997.1 phage portal protein [Sphingomonas sp. SFZ2018-12]
MTALSPDDYRRAAGYRRSSAFRGGAATRAPVMAYETFDLGDPDLRSLMSGGRETIAGVTVGAKSALRNSTFFRAMSLIAGSMGMLPLHLMRRMPDGTTEKAKDHGLFNLLHRKPNNFQTASEFKSYMQLACLLDGNAYALKIRSRGQVTELIPLPRHSVTPKLSDSWQMTFEYRRPSGGTAVLDQRNVFRFRSPLSLDGYKGVSMLDVAADTIGMAVRARGAAARLLTKGSMARGALETDATLGDEAFDNLRKSLQENYAGTDAQDDWMILEEGLKAKPFGSSARDAQLTEMTKHLAEEVARFTGAPRPLLMFDETSWGSGVRELGLYFVTYCLMQWFVIWEEAVWLCLLSPAEQETYYAKFNEGALLRGSLKDQADFFKAALGPNSAFMVPNEARENFDMNPIPGGDELPRPGTTGASIAQEDTGNA